MLAHIVSQIIGFIVVRDIIHVTASNNYSRQRRERLYEDPLKIKIDF
jgi:hypothetical protein